MGLLDTIREAVKGEDKPRKSYQSGPKVGNKSRLEGACASGDKASCEQLERMKNAQNTDSNN